MPLLMPCRCRDADALRRDDMMLMMLMPFRHYAAMPLHTPLR